jgi:hypothetical protein
LERLQLASVPTMLTVTVYVVEGRLHVVLENMISVLSLLRRTELFDAATEHSLFEVHSGILWDTCARCEMLLGSTPSL